MTTHDDVVAVRTKWFVKVRTVFPFPKDMVLHRSLHSHRDVLHVVKTMLVQSVGRVDDWKAGRSCSQYEPGQILDQADSLNLVLDLAVDFAVSCKKVVQNVNEDEGGNIGGINRDCHRSSFLRMGDPPGEKARSRAAVALRRLLVRVVSLPNDVDFLDASDLQNAHIPVSACYFKN